MEKQKFGTKWNWGAFVNPIGFGVGNRAYLCLLALVPILNIVWIFIAGAKGESWALANSENVYRDEEEFRKIMDTWKRGGLVQFIILAVVIVAEIVIFTVALSAAITSLNSLEHEFDTQTSYSQTYDDDYGDDYDDYNFED